MVRSQNPPRLDIQEELWLNEYIGVAEEAFAAEAVAVDVAAQGAIRRKWNASRLLIDNDVCRGVERIDGTSTKAETTIVAIGPWTPGPLESWENPNTSCFSGWLPQCNWLSVSPDPLPMVNMC